ncbi:molybdopterin-synthase adenylyltransferase MoeB [Aquimarina sp. 2201CG5-10]|uniref:molybdopterin-synthase adenylyltransferase MoeB n=1 Tax=Aquimarina callyspongiae TaxID=3098150 RepID=UPI002AB3D762|nr:molybdopterin-synthase adenylyltransferase MoeB [Aquimarina sp. 2201CG5-10]MDY8135020.1 molybdopterin-synthase adenylyltransferase MoeB [Aquimarina sp. 2201CG5-10]
MLNTEEKIQYNRHLILDEIGTEGQEKLKLAKVLVIGAGGLGCPVLQYLTAVGVGTIGIIDNDVVDQTNLQRQILYTIDDVGISKAKSAAKRLSKLNPFVFFKVYDEKLDSENALDLFLEYDIIVDGSDNFPTRYLVNDACVLADKPLVFGSIFKFQGQVSVFNYQNGPTYRCLFPDPPEPGAVPNCSDIGVLGVLPGIIGSLQANEVIKMITGLGEVLNGKLLYFDTLTLQQQIISFHKNEDIEIDTLENDYDFFCGIDSEVINEISVSELKESLENYQILDVRTQLEFDKFNIGGMHIPLDQVSKRVSEISSEKPIVVCCQSGVRSKKAIQIISEHRDDLDLMNLTQGLSLY